MAYQKYLDYERFRYLSMSTCDPSLFRSNSLGVLLMNFSHLVYDTIYIKNQYVNFDIHWKRMGQENLMSL